MAPLWRRLVASLACAVLIVLWMFGLDRLTRNLGDVANFAIVLGISWLITYRAWPAVEITWEFFTSPGARRAYTPTWPHVLGALGLGLGIPLVQAAPLLFAGRESDVDLIARTRGGLLLALFLYYIAWPAIVVRWRRSRASNS